MSYLLGIDLGTSSVKVALVDVDTLQAIADADAEYPIQHPQAHYAEQDPDAWWRATVKATREVLATVDTPEILAIGLSGQMHGFVPLGNNHQPLAPAIIWADGRSATQVQALLEFATESASAMPGYPAIGFAASSALWLKQHQPDLLTQMTQWCLPKDYLRLKLTGVVATEPSDAASTWLYDVAKHRWAEDVSVFCGLSPAQMPKVMPSHAISGYLTTESATELGLSEGIPVVGGSADLPAQGLGYGISNPNTLLITVGSGGQVFIPTADPIIRADNPFYVFNHNVPETWYVQTSILTAGLAMRWLRDLLNLQEQADAYAHLSTLAESVDAGSDGLRFLPYLAGERNPNPDANADGAMVGLRLNHGRQHLARAIMEGVAFAIKESLSHVPNNAQSYLLAGGITNSPVWCQILADVLDHDLQTPLNPQPYGCIGVAILAGVGAGHFASIDDAISHLNHGDIQTYTPHHSQAYHDAYQQFLSMYHFMKS